MQFPCQKDPSTTTTFYVTNANYREIEKIALTALAMKKDENKRVPQEAKISEVQKNNVVNEEIGPEGPIPILSRSWEQFTVSEIFRDDWHRVGEIAEEWLKKAEKKYAEIIRPYQKEYGEYIFEAIEHKNHWINKNLSNEDAQEYLKNLQEWDLFTDDDWKKPATEVTIGNWKTTNHKLARIRQLLKKEAQSPFSDGVPLINLENPGKNLKASIEIIRCIRHSLLESEYRSTETWDTVITCSDKEGNIQAVALHDVNANELAFIATEPDNVEIKYPEHQENHHAIRKTRGAGSHIILYLAANSLIKNSPLKVNATDSAIPFYTKMHFKIGRYERWTGTTEMTLTTDTIDKLIQKKTSPFHKLENHKIERD